MVEENEEVVEDFAKRTYNYTIKKAPDGRLFYCLKNSNYFPVYNLQSAPSLEYSPFHPD